MMEAMIPSQVGMSLRTLQKIKEAKEAQIKKEAKEAHQKNKKNERKERRGNATIPFSTLVLQSSTMFFHIESLLCCHFIY